MWVTHVRTVRSKQRQEKQRKREERRVLSWKCDWVPGEHLDKDLSHIRASNGKTQEGEEMKSMGSFVVRPVSYLQGDLQPLELLTNFFEDPLLSIGSWSSGSIPFILYPILSIHALIDDGKNTFAIENLIIK